MESNKKEGDLMDINNQDFRKMAQMAQKMQGKSENDIIKDLARMIKSGEGGITPEKAQRMIKALQPMLDANQRRKLEKLMKEING